MSSVIISQLANADCGRHFASTDPGLGCAFASPSVQLYSMSDPVKGTHRTASKATLCPKKAR